MILDLIGKEKVDRLPVLVSVKGVSQLLTVAKLPSGTGEAQAAAVFGAIEDSGVADSIRAMCFDTNQLKHWSDRWCLCPPRAEA